MISPRCSELHRLFRSPEVCPPLPGTNAGKPGGPGARSWFDDVIAVVRRTGSAMRVALQYTDPDAVLVARWAYAGWDTRFRVWLDLGGPGEWDELMACRPLKLPAPTWAQIERGWHGDLSPGLGRKTVYSRAP